MIRDMSSSTGFVISVGIATIILIYHTYQIWFFPEKYTSDYIKGIKNWWPFADFYRKWYASKGFLWLFRIAYTLMLLFLILLLSIVVLGVMGLFP